MARHIHIHIGGKRKVKDKRVNDVQFAPGDKVHLGMGTKGGAGVFGVLIKIENGYAFVKNSEGRTFKGPISLLSEG